MKNRLKYIDVAKGIGILLMILGHIGFGDGVYTAIYSFHMPMFFYISGLLFTCPDSYKLKKRCKSLIIPYFSLGVFFLVVDWAFYGFDLTKLYCLLWDNSNGLPIESALWFLTAMLICQLIYTFLDKIIGNDLVLLLCSCCVSIIACLITNEFGIFTPFSFQAGMVGVMYYSVGRFLAKKKFYEKESATWTFVIFCLIPTLAFLATYLPLHNMRIGLYGLVPITEIVALILSVCVVYISKYIPSRMGDFFASFGKNSIIYLGLNHLGIKVSRFLLALTPFVENKIIFKLSQVVLCLVLLFAAAFIIKGTSLRKFFGIS